MSESDASGKSRAQDDDTTVYESATSRDGEASVCGDTVQDNPNSTSSGRQRVATLRDDQTSAYGRRSIQDKSISALSDDLGRLTASGGGQESNDSDESSEDEVVVLFERKPQDQIPRRPVSPERPEVVHQCPDCALGFLKYSHLEHHQEVHHTPKINPVSPITEEGSVNDITKDAI